MYGDADARLDGLDQATLEAAGFSAFADTGLPASLQSMLASRFAEVRNMGLG